MKAALFSGGDKLVTYWAQLLLAAVGLCAETSVLVGRAELLYSFSPLWKRCLLEGFSLEGDELVVIISLPYPKLFKTHNWSRCFWCYWKALNGNSYDPCSPLLGSSESENCVSLDNTSLWNTNPACWCWTLGFRGGEVCAFWRVKRTFFHSLIWESMSPFYKWWWGQRRLLLWY